MWTLYSVPLPTMAMTFRPRLNVKKFRVGRNVKAFQPRRNFKTFRVRKAKHDLEKGIYFHRRANSAHIRQSRPDAGRGLIHIHALTLSRPRSLSLSLSLTLNPTEVEPMWTLYSVAPRNVKTSKSSFGLGKATETPGRDQTTWTRLPLDCRLRSTYPHFANRGPSLIRNRPLLKDHHRALGIGPMLL